MFLTEFHSMQKFIGPLSYSMNCAKNVKADKLYQAASLPFEYKDNWGLY